jgi:hypothetical protein
VRCDRANGRNYRNTEVTERTDDTEKGNCLVTMEDTEDAGLQSPRSEHPPEDVR